MAKPIAPKGGSGELKPDTSIKIKWAKSDLKKLVKELHRLVKKEINISISKILKKYKLKGKNG